MGPFRSVMLMNGGHVVLRYGAQQRVTLLEGAGDCMKVSVDGNLLVIDRQHGKCSRNHDVMVEVETPALEAIAVRDGGSIETRGTFPRQVELDAAVESGGVLDLRAMTVDHVNAAVREGGRILTRPRESLVAKIASGGAVTYWGSPDVQSSVKDGGAVWKGSNADAGKPLDEIGYGTAPVPPIPPVPPTPPVPPARRGSI